MCRGRRQLQSAHNIAGLIAHADGADPDVRGFALDHHGYPARLGIAQRSGERIKRCPLVIHIEFLQQHLNQSVATNTHPPERIGIVAHVISEEAAAACGHDFARMLSEIAFQAAAADEAGMLAAHSY